MSYHDVSWYAMSNTSTDDRRPSDRDPETLLPLTPALFHVLLSLVDGQKHGYAILATMATLYAWGWMTREKSWLEGMVSLSVTEWANDDRLHHDIGGGLSSRMAKRWMDDLGFGWEQMPNFKVHSQADEEHSDMFLEDLESFAVGDKEGLVIQAAKESMELHKLFRGGIAKEMERLG